MKISVFTPTLDRPDFLKRAAVSVLLQTHQDWEWVVMDVGQEPAQHVLPADNRIRYRYQPPAQGPAPDYQRALDLCTGEVVHPLGDDDLLMRNALEIVASEMNGHDWLVGTTELYDANGRMRRKLGGTQQSFDRTMAGSFVLGGAVYWRRTLSDRLGGFNPDFSGAADVDLYMRFGRDSAPRIIPDVLYRYTDHPGTDSRRNPTNQHNQVRRILHHLRRAS